MANQYLAPVGDGSRSTTANVAPYNFTTMNQDFIVFDTPGLSDSRGDDKLTDEDIKD